MYAMDIVTNYTVIIMKEYIMIFMTKCATACVTKLSQLGQIETHLKKL